MGRPKPYSSFHSRTKPKGAGGVDRLGDHTARSNTEGIPFLHTPYTAAIPSTLSGEA